MKANKNEIINEKREIAATTNQRKIELKTVTRYGRTHINTIPNSRREKSINQYHFIPNKLIYKTNAVIFM